MNQIIFVSNKTPEDSKFENDKKIISKYKYLLYFCVFIIIISIIIYIINRYNSYKKEKLSKALINNFNITRLYSDSNNSNLSLENNFSKESNSFVIGLIEIKKIDIMYPILFQTNEELLKIAPCRFLGPMPNKVRKSLYCWA